MRNLQLHIVRTLLLLLSVGMIANAQTISENYNNGSINQRKTACWIFDDFEINNKNPINGGGNKKHGATVDMDQGGLFSGTDRAGFTTPFIYFDGTGTITFKHKADDDDYGFFGRGNLRVKLVDPYNAGPTVLNHVYKRVNLFSPNPNGPPDVTQNATINVTWTGYYRVEWEWEDNSSANTDYFIDDLVIDTGAYSLVETDIVCEGETAQHTPVNAVTAGNPYNFEYTWSWVGTAGGTLSAQTANDRRAQVVWNVGPGTYRLKSVETYDNGNCNGRTFYIDVTVSEQPTFTVVMDTVCEGFQATMLFDGLIGKAPYTITYNDGSGSKVFTTTGSSESVLLDKVAVDVNITDVVDDDGCHADPALLIAYPIYYHPEPNTDPIYHY